MVTQALHGKNLYKQPKLSHGSLIDLLPHWVLYLFFQGQMEFVIDDLPANKKLRAPPISETSNSMLKNFLCLNKNETERDASSGFKRLGSVGLSWPVPV